MTAIKQITSGTFAKSVARHGRAVARCGPGRMSDLLDDILSKQARGFNEEDGDQNHERHAIAVLASARQVADNHHFNESEHHRPKNRAGNVADATEYRRNERLD